MSSAQQRVVIGLGFRARSGKDTVGKVLCDRHGFRPVSFAAALKRAAREIFGLTEAQTDGDLKQVVDSFWGETPRRLLQVLGTECLREGFRDDVWIKVVERTILMSDHPRWVVTDVRFPNEASTILYGWGGCLVRVDRDSRASVEKHVSETAMESWTAWDAVIDNNQPLDTLPERVDAMIAGLRGIGAKAQGLHSR